MEGMGKWLERRKTENKVAIKQRLSRDPDKYCWEITMEAPQKFHAVVELDKKYELSNVLGVGGYGIVVSAREYDQRDGKEERIAIKRVVFRDRARKTIERCIRELRIIGKIHHPFIVKVKGVINQARDVDEFDEYFIVMERMKLSLQELKEVHIMQGIKFKPEVVRVIMAQLLRGLQYLHAARILHRDLKPHNILVSESHSNNSEKFRSFIPRIKLCDFGISRKIAPKMTGFVATASYRAPEHFFGHEAYQHYFKYGPATDVWAVGCILAELLLVNRLGSKGILFVNVRDNMGDNCKNLDEYAKLIQMPEDLNEQAEFINGEEYLFHIHTSKTFPRRPKFPLKKLLVSNGADERAIDLVEKMLCFNPAKRISIDEAFKHEYVADYSVEKLGGTLQLKADEIQKLKQVEPPLVNTNDDEIQNSEDDELIDLLFDTTKTFKIENA